MTLCTGDTGDDDADGNLASAVSKLPKRSSSSSRLSSATCKSSSVAAAGECETSSVACHSSCVP